ncbi:MAG: hypothetical protein Q6L58_10075, partial [Thermostichales cyanobacterium BF3_bins_165]
DKPGGRGCGKFVEKSRFSVENLWKSTPTYSQGIYTLWKNWQVFHIFSTGGRGLEGLEMLDFAQVFHISTGPTTTKYIYL